MNKKISGFLCIMFFTCCIFSCNTTEPHVDDEKENTWEIIPELSELSVRYILKHKNTVYLSGVLQSETHRGEIWKSTDGSTWEMLRSFRKVIGPLTTNGDTLYCLGDSLFRYIIPQNKWENVCQPLPLTIDPHGVSEMIFLKNELYAMQNYTDAPSTYKIHFDGTVEEIFVLGYTWGGSKFIKKENVTDWCYVRGRYFNGGFYTFDGNRFTKIKGGLTDKEWLNPPTNSMEIKNDTLFAGFRFPGLIKFLNNDVWIDYTDTLPYHEEHSNLLYTEPTEITFVKQRMFVSTESLGVLEWNKEKGWTQISKGLVEYDWAELYKPIVFLESINETLLAAYGDPGYASWGGVGVYKLKIY